VILTKYAGNCLILVIANPPTHFYDENTTTSYVFNRTNLETYLAGKKLSEAEEVLQVGSQLDSPQTAVPYTGGSEYIPMSGVASATKIDKNTTVNGDPAATDNGDKSTQVLQLTRMVARIAVQSTASNFVLNSATVINAPRRGKIYCDGTTLLDNSGTNELTQYSADIATAAGTAPYSTTANPIYIYESRKEEQTALILKGTYNTTTVGYYKVFITDATGAPIDIERNKAYLVNVTDAGPGYSSLSEAEEAPASNIRTTIQVTDQNPYDMVSNGQYYLGVSNSELVIYDYAARATNYTAFTITTDATSGIGLATPTITSTNTGFTLQPASQTMTLGASGITTKQMIIQWPAISANTTGTITVKVGNLTRTVTITRKPTINAGGLQELDGINYVSGVVTNSGTGNWLFLSEDGITPATNDIIYSTPNKIYVVADPNVTLIQGGAIPANRIGAECYLVRTDDNGGGRVKVLVSQAGAVTTVIKNSYVGAFWRNDQKGERLIKVTGLTDAATRGQWTARVISGKEWIMLDTENTKDTYVPYAAAATTNMADMLNSTVDDYHSLLSGNLVVADNTNATQIYFRIGLRERLADGVAPRYGLVILSYNNNTKFQAIFIRQGHEPDFLFRNGHTEDVYNGSIQRTQSAKFNPYNLTDPKGYDGSSDATLHTQLPVGGYAPEEHFTKYPSQVGYLFQWASASPRRAFHPINPSSYTNWPAAVSTGFWGGSGGIGSTNESCPTGYRRPSDGSTTTNSSYTALSEARESLAISPQSGTSMMLTGNMVGGFLADGFFDRRNIHVVWGSSLAMCVSYSTATPALNKYLATFGALYFNPNNHASIFFPSTISRNNTGGYFVNDQTWSPSRNEAMTFYSTSSHISTNTALLSIVVTHERPTVVSAIGINSSQAWNVQTRYAYTIRCVKDS
jgi:hypothetical protein